MREFQRWQPVLGLMVMSFAGAVQSWAAHPPEAQVSFTIQVRNDAQVDARELAEAERVAAAIFRKSGVASNWVDANELSESGNSNSADPDGTLRTQIYVHIRTSAMADSLGLPNIAMGLAPGIGADRQHVYVFYDRVKGLAQRQVTAHIKGDIVVWAGQGQILGEMIAHEIGHVLLNLPSHSETGIMRGGWDLKDLQDIAYGNLLFTKQQAEVIRAEVMRRAS